MTLIEAAASLGVTAATLRQRAKAPPWWFDRPRVRQQLLARREEQRNLARLADSRSTINPHQGGSE